MLSSMSLLHYWINWSLCWFNTSNTQNKPIQQEICRLSSLHQAAKKGDTNTLQVLLSQGQSIHELCHQGYSLLHHASIQGHADCVALLIDNGANVEAKACGGISPLHKAAEKGCIRSVNFLLKAGANIDVKDCTGHSPLHAGARFGHVKIIAQLLKKGAKYLPDQKGYTPLDEAIKYKQRHAIAFLSDTLS